MFSITNLGIGTKLSVLVLAGTVLTVVASGVHTSKTLYGESLRSELERAHSITQQALSTLEYVDEMHAKEGIFDDARLVSEAQSAIQGAQSVDDVIQHARGTKIYKTLPVVAAWEIAQRAVFTSCVSSGGGSFASGRSAWNQSSRDQPCEW